MKRCAIALCLLLSAAGGREEGVINPDPYLPLIEQGFLHEVVWQALEGVELVPRPSAEALAVTPATSTATVPAGVGPLAVKSATSAGTVPPAVGAVQPAKAPGAEAGLTVPGAPLAVGAQPDVLAVAAPTPSPITGVSVPSAAPVKNPRVEAGSVRPVVPAAGGNGSGSMAVKPAGGASITGPDMWSVVRVDQPVAHRPEASDSTEATTTAVLAGSDAALLAKLRYGTEDPHATLAGLGIEDLLKLLDALPLRGEGVEPAGDSLTARLLAVDDAVLERPSELSYNAAMQLAGALSRAGDERCVAVYEGLLARRTLPASGFVPEVMYLAQYYEGLGDHNMAARTWLRMPAYTSQPFARADCHLLAGHHFYLAGNVAASAQHLALVSQFGNGWATGMAAAEAAAISMANGDLETALTLLRRPIAGALADQIRPHLTQRTGQYLIAAGRYREASIDLDAAVAQFDALPRILPNEGLEASIRTASRLQREVREALEAPIVCPSRVTLTLTRDGSTSTVARVRALRGRQLLATSVADWGTLTCERSGTFSACYDEYALSVSSTAPLPKGSYTMRVHLALHGEPAARATLRLIAIQ